jgi:DNA-binding transcriptional LysR family regulator
MLELHELQVFLVAAETENFSEAGRTLQISQPAVSGQIQALESRLGTQLFDRVGRSIKLNEVGEALVPIVRNLLKEAERVEEFVALRQGTVIGRLMLGCSTSAGKYILPQVMARFLEAFPDVQIHCEVGPRGAFLDRLITGEIDVAVSNLRVPRRAIEYQYFSDDLVVLIAPASHPWAQAGSLKPADLVEHPLVLREPGSGTVFTLNRALVAHDMSLDMLKSRLTLWNTEAIVQAVICGIGPAFVSRIAAGPALEQGIVVEVPVEGMRLIQRLYIARHTGFRATEAQTAFWEFVFAPENQDLRQFFT